jgi:hypothetical protein
LHVFRIHIRPQGGSADWQTAFAYCIKNGLLGVGWRTESNRNTKDWDEYYKEASQLYDDLSGSTYIHSWVKEGDLVWTRSPSPSEYYLARVTSDWEYWASDEGRARDIDIANIFRCDIRRVKIDEVPGKVVNCFRPARTIQEIADEAVLEYSKHLWNKLCGQPIYETDTAKFSDIFMMLDPEETEDVLFLYLQNLEWFVVPSSRKADTTSFENYVVNRKTMERASTQVKTGHVALNRDDYADTPRKVFLFQSNDIYTGSEHENVVCVRRDEMLKFLRSSRSWLPQVIVEKMNMLGI